MRGSGRYDDALREAQRAVVTAALKECGGSITAAAQWLGITRAALSRLLGRDGGLMAVARGAWERAGARGKAPGEKSA